MPAQTLRTSALRLSVLRNSANASTIPLPCTVTSFAEPLAASSSRLSDSFCTIRQDIMFFKISSSCSSFRIGKFMYGLRACASWPASRSLTLPSPMASKIALRMSGGSLPSLMAPTTCLRPCLTKCNFTQSGTPGTSAPRERTPAKSSACSSVMLGPSSSSLPSSKSLSILFPALCMTAVLLLGQTATAKPPTWGRIARDILGSGMTLPG
mmetsp:Transcript_118381/g.230368  ORF Transcript_118381/g.230368 Transcript_118381/m.230368 type:complete len:210 (+) Transcript_118381:552-1181(+)